MKNAVRYLAMAITVVPLLISRGFCAEATLQKRVIVVDAGHGGDDTGAIGPTGVREKDVALSVAKKLSSELTKRPDIRVVLTREDDTFIPLKERTEMANREKAAIFISIHANAAMRSGASGVETYFLSFEASDSDSRKLAAFENNVVSIGEGARGESADDIENIIWDLTETETLKESGELAESVHTSLMNSTGGENRGVKQAPFFVLAGATMPAVLVEVGFISNPEEEQRLSSDGFHETIAAAIVRGVEEFERELGRREGLANFYDEN